MHLVQTRLSSLIYDDLELDQLGLLRAGSVFRRSDLPVSPVPETLTGGVGVSLTFSFLLHTILGVSGNDHKMPSPFFPFPTA